ncbi:VanZ family protein [Uliginosibacterium sp. TH139]|uniref:VanZ family protein n=1 Tax=Uliginosibacterium sp. TH139 TaxID=2067453 RepID=UPI000C7D192E|nr:VanZ family protein [Uliginosibacterium sp. TH139]PLK49261.1 hypothetical protein C0V76_08670 [Uliginosibacterium sp. TH139]
MNPHGRLPRYLCALWLGLTLYACLHPFSGWTSPGVSPLAFLVAPWQKYISQLDVWLNIAGFLPFGFTLAASIASRRKPGRIVLGVLLASLLLSFAIEFAQNWLPGRISSNLDLATNTFGGVLGALAGLRWGHFLAEGGALQRWRRQALLPGHVGEFGLLLVGLWWLAQLEPTGLLFGNGDLRSLLDLPAPLAFSARRYLLLETAVVASSTLALGLLLARGSREASLPRLLGVLLAGLALRTLACALFLVPADPWQWATPGAVRGLLLGAVLSVLALRLPRWSQHALVSLTLLLSTALVNLAPDNPFIDASVRTLQQGHFLNFYGLTQLVSSLWPFLALAWLSAQAGLQRR